MSPTAEQVAAYERMFAHFNKALFSGTLPAPLLNLSRATSRTLGFFAPSRWERGSEVRHEISLNPMTLKSRSALDVASTLVHEMVHLWQQECGKPSRTGYHNKEWAQKMEAVGLVPSDTGAPGGAKVGQKMTHYVAEDGPFASAFAKMPKEYALPWVCEEAAGGKKKRKANKTKYVCAGCGANVWGKPDMFIVCKVCEETFEETA